MTVSFDALSYAGRLAVCAVYDPEHVPDHAVLRSALEGELAELRGPPLAQDVTDPAGPAALPEVTSGCRPRR